MGKSHLHRSGFLDLRQDGADLAEIHLQAIVVEPMQSGGVLWLEAHEKFAGDIPRRPHTDQILPVDKPEEAAVDRDLGNIPPGIGKTSILAVPNRREWARRPESTRRKNTR